MELVWKQGEVNNASILKELEGEPNWTRHTVKTYLKRLVEKGLLGLRQISPRKFKYYPLLTKEEFLAEEASAYLHNHFNGLTHMIAGLVDNEKISDNEIDSLEQYIKTLKENRKG
jgi:BlaI family penicillinase repressor